LVYGNHYNCLTKIYLIYDCYLGYFMCL